MTLGEALRGLCGLPSHVAMRPTGIMIVMNTNQAVFKIGKNGPHTWAAKFGDLVALDWQVFSPEQMAQMRAAQAELDAQRAAAEHEAPANE
jgi:hypothetical protein